MTQLPGTSPRIYGMHEPPPYDVMPPPSWILFLEQVGHSTDPCFPSQDYNDWAEQGYGTIVRIQHEWNPGGTLPTSANLDAFVERVHSLVWNSLGCSRWIIGNEPSNRIEWPDGVPLTPEYVAWCYNRCWQAIHDVPGHKDDEVLLPPIGPWNAESGIDWITYFERLIEACNTIDGFALHTYSRGSATSSITDQSKMGSYPEYYNGWPTLYDWLYAIPEQYRDRPCYLTETDQINDPVGWSTTNTGWVTAMYSELNRHNQEGTMHKGELLTQKVRCALLYRWPHYDNYGIEGNQAITDDFQHAQTFGYTWTDDTEPPEPPEETMLKNPSFEEGWHEHGASELVLPDYWALDYVDGNHPWCGPQGKRPEVKPNQEYVTDGEFSIRAFPPAHSRGMFGIYQEVESVPGQWYRFTAKVRIESNPPGEMAGFVGIQPWGGGLFERQMVWGKETQKIGEWVSVEVIAQAYGGWIRVAMGANNKWATQNNTVWWDDAHLEVFECDDGGGTEPPVEPPEPGECDFDAEVIRQIIQDEVPTIVRKELDATHLTGAA